MKKYAIIVAGGSGTRMGTGIPKQFLLLEGKPVLMHTIRKFHSSEPDMKIILVLPASQLYYWEELCKEYLFNIEIQVTSGGETRFHSVKNGLDSIETSGIVGVHDGVRPLLSPALITRLYASAAKQGNAIPCILPHESVRIQEAGGNRAIDRSICRLIQTPQCFDVDQLKKAYRAGYRQDFTDDATVAEAAGIRIHLEEGEAGNIKITTPTDLAIASALLRSQDY